MITDANPNLPLSEPQQVATQVGQKVRFIGRNIALAANDDTSDVRLSAYILTSNVLIVITLSLSLYICVCDPVYGLLSL